MKKFTVFIIGGIALLMACTADPALDSVASIYEDKERLNSDIDIRSSGTFDMAWIVDKQVVDTATFSTEWDSEYRIISHFPVEYLYRKLVGKNASIIYNKQSYWPIKMSFVGISTGNAYYANSPSQPSTTFKMNGVEWFFIPEIRTSMLEANSSSLIYDYNKDVWSGAVNMDSCIFVNRENLEIKRYDFNPPLTLSFQTTGRKKK